MTISTHSIRWTVVAVALASLSLLQCSSGNDTQSGNPSTTSCTPSQPVPCQCAGLSSGTATCLADGRSLSACVCAPGGAGGAFNGGSGAGPGRGAAGGTPTQNAGGFSPGGGGTAGSGGGAQASGGSSGASSSGGAQSAGGAQGAGGAQSTGGAQGEGGAQSAGGVQGTGGAGPTSSGCGLDPAATGTGSLDVGGTSRTYILDLPPGYDKSKQYPVLFGFHGATTSGSLFRSQYYGNLASAAGSEAILVYPDALGNPTAWGYTLTNNVDVTFFDALLAKIESQYCVDTHRIFVAGHSSGAFFSNILGCVRGDVLRGIAPVSGGGPFGGSSCKGEIAAWIAHGTNDPTVALSSGQGSRDFWVNANGCDGATSSPVTPSPCVEYASCDAGFPVRWCQHDGDHNWPAFAPQGIWSFFKGL